MQESPIYPRYEKSDYHGSEFDYQANFTQFLEKARRNTNQGTQNTANLHSTGKKQLNEEKKNRKSWKNTLFSWLKTEKKSKSTKQQMNRTAIHNPSRGFFSGPVQVLEPTNGRAKKPISGPLTGFFSSTKRIGDYEGHYMCLSQTSNLQKLHYGPVYLVT